MNVAGTKALVTGATGGIGQAIARALSGAGASVVLSGRRTDVLEPLAVELGAHVIAADLAERDAVQRLADTCADVDILVANAALPASGHLNSFAVDEIDRALEVNLRAPVVLARLLAPAMIERGRGHIVLISSLAGKTTTSGSSIYSATKFGLRGFGQALRADLRGSGVSASVVFPGFVRDAGMFHESGAELPGYVGTSTPEDVAGGVLRAIERDRGEIDVAPATVRLGVRVAQVAPGASAHIKRRLGEEDLAAEIASGQADKR
jgi:short-subunit dehydrogenase